MEFVIGNANKMLLLLLFLEIKALIDRIVGAWLGKNITRHYLPKGLTMLFLLTVIAILVNDLLRKMIKYQVMQRIRQAKASFPRRSACCC